MLFESRDFEIEAWVETLHDKKRFKEHQVEYDEDEETGEPTGLVTSYLECKEGKAFRVKFRCIRPATPHPDMRISVSIDGREIRGRAWTGRHKEADVGLMYVRDEDGMQQAADLVFAKLPTVEDIAEAEIRGAALDPLCKIEVTIRHGSYKRLSDDNNYPRSMTDASIGTVYEICSTVKASNLRVTKQKPGLVFTPAEEDPDVCYFRWNYYNLDKLTTMGIFETPEEKAAKKEAEEKFRKAVKRLAEDPEYANNDDCVITSSKRAKVERVEAEENAEEEEEEEEADVKPVIEQDEPRTWSGLQPTQDGLQLDVDQASSPMPSRELSPFTEPARSPARHLPSSPMFEGEGEWSANGLDRDDSPLFDEPAPQASSPAVRVADLQIESASQEVEETQEYEQTQDEEEESVRPKTSEVLVEETMAPEESSRVLVEETMDLESEEVSRGLVEETFQPEGVAEAEMETQEEAPESSAVLEAESNLVGVMAK